MTDFTHEAVRAGVLFGVQGFKPVWFAIAGRQVKISSIQFTWTERKEGELLYMFNVTDGVDMYELTFSARDMRWYVNV